MKKIYMLLLASTAALVSQAQTYCTPAVIPYASTMPGITHFVLNTIDRPSAALEHPGSGFVSTGLSTTLIMGQTYTVSITHTVDAPICPDMNIRVWIDYNHDGELDDSGETVISVNHHAPGTYTGTFTVPTAPSYLITPGSTRLRASVKMSDLGGHTLPTPCDMPADPFGYHGEMEDYTVNLTSVSAVSEINAGISLAEVYPNPLSSSSIVRFNLVKPGRLTAELFNSIGEKIATLINGETLASGEHEYPLGLIGNENGLYFIRIETESGRVIKTIIYGR